MLSIGAEKLLLWFNRYKISPAKYYYNLAKYKNVTKKGLFATNFSELLAEYGYSY